MSAQKEIFIVAGGSGGHIMPAIAVGEALYRLAPEIPVSFICGRKPLEAELFRRSGIKPHIVSAMPIYRRLDLRLYGYAQLLLSFVEAMLILRRRRCLVLGMGGYVSAPVICAAYFLGKPFFLHEQNSIPGKTNRFLANKARLVFCSFTMTADMLPRDRCRVVGIPVRSFILSASREEALGFFNLDGAAPVLLVLGGSQGARSLNQLVLSVLKRISVLLKQINQRLTVVWSTGVANFNFVAEQIKALNLDKIEVKSFPFIERIDMAYAVANLALCRAGAATLAELAVRQVPAIIIPYPYAKDKHQYYNARQFVAGGGGLLFEENSLNAQRLAEEIIDLIKRPERLKQMSQAGGNLTSSAAAERIAGELINQAKNLN